MPSCRPLGPANCFGLNKMTSHRIGVNLRVSGNCDQGARKYMEDNHVIKFLKKDTDDYEFAYFGIFDGHGGPEASAFCRDNLLNEITKYDGFWTDDDDQVLVAIRKGFLDTHHAMWNVLDTWPKTVTGLPSTAGSTATIAIIKQGKLYTGHVGDSALVLGENDAYAGDQFPVQAICITKEHKPDDPDERLRIEDAGGEVINKSGVPRVVWSRPKTNHKGPVRRSTQIDQIPFLAVARSLGDLWSYDYYTETYVVSPDPDVTVLKLDPTKHRCLILASDGLWNMLTPEEAVNIVMDLETQFEQKIIHDPNVAVSFWSNPAERLVSRALNKWRSKSLKADNTSCVVVLIDPLGPSKLTLLKRKRQELLCGGEIAAQVSKAPKLPLELDNRGKIRNKNANCSLSDSHIRVTDASIIEPISEREHLTPLALTASATTSKPELLNTTEDLYNESINDSVQYIPKGTGKWNLRHLVESDSMNVSSLKTGANLPRRIPPPPTLNAYSKMFGLSSSDNAHNKTETGFTKLVGSNVSKANVSTASCRKEFKKEKHGKKTKDLKHENKLLVDNIKQDCLNFEEDIELEEMGKSSDSDAEKSLPQPPPSTPCSDVRELDRDGESDGENSLHSSADVTDKAFSLASDESIESAGSSFGGEDRPRTPLSAPAKLSSSRQRRSHLSKSAKRKLAKEGKKLRNFSKPPPGLTLKAKGTLSLLKSPSAAVKSTMISPQAAGVHSNIDPAKASARAKGDSVTKLVDSITVVGSAKPNVVVKMGESKVLGKQNNLISSPKCTSPPRRVLNTSKSMNDVATPRNQKESGRSISCTGLTPDMSLLLTEKPKSVLSSAMGTCTLSSDITTHLLSSLMAADRSDLKAAAATVKSQRECSMIVEDYTMPHASSGIQTKPLGQLNKTGPIHKTGSKRWGNFLRASKMGIDQMFNLGNHRKNSETGNCKLATTSTGKLECSTTKMVGTTKHSTLSTSKLGDMTLSHLPDITMNNFADITVNASTLTAGDLTTLSALSADESMLSAVDLTTAHHSMLDTSLSGKVSKPRKGFLQKTRVTLRRARKAAKKAFFPENHRLFNHKSSGIKRRSDEFIPTPELKRRRQLMAEKT